MVQDCGVQCLGRQVGPQQTVRAAGGPGWDGCSSQNLVIDQWKRPVPGGPVGSLTVPEGWGSWRSGSGQYKAARPVLSSLARFSPTGWRGTPVSWHSVREAFFQRQAECSLVGPGSGAGCLAGYLPDSEVTNSEECEARSPPALSCHSL